MQNKSNFFILFSLVLLSSFGFSSNAYASINSATGGTITYDGSWTIHTFTSSGTFTVLSGSGDVEYLVIGGGGGGGNGLAGGGGAGAYRTGTHAVNDVTSTYTVTIGAGGAGSTTANTSGSNGGSSVFDTITSTGGGYGGGENLAGGVTSGGSAGGSGNTATQTAGGTYGNDGGGDASGTNGGGGGGSGANGNDGSGLNGGDGGTGTYSSISGSSVCRAGGGGGAGYSTGTNGSGQCGGGSGTATAGTSATANTGSGGGGGRDPTYDGGNGGSGIVILRYQGIPSPDAVDDLVSLGVTQTTASLDWTEPNLNTGNLTNYLLNSTTPHGTPLTFVVNVTNSDHIVTGLSLGTDYSFRVSALTEGGYNATGNILNITTTIFNPPNPPTLGAVALSDSAIRFTSVSGGTGDNATAWYGFRCSTNGGAYNTVVSNSSIPVDRVQEETGLSLGDEYICQWRDGSSAGWSPWSNNATDVLELQIVQSARSSNADPLKNFETMIDQYGGIFFGLSLFPFIVMIIGFMATPKTVGIFALITLMLMGIIHASGYFVYPEWYWFMMFLFAIPIIFTRARN